MVNGGFGQENLRKFSENRSDDYRLHAARSKQDIEAAEFPPGVAETASELLRTAAQGTRSVTKARIKERDPVELDKLSTAALAVVAQSDSLVDAVGVRSALIAVRQALYRSGSHTLDPDRVQELQGLISEPHFRAVRNMANFGASLLQSVEVPCGDKAPFGSARAVAPEIMLAALKDAAGGLSLMISEEASGAKLRAAGPVFNPAGAVPKKDARGLPTSLRVITDARLFNLALSTQAPHAEVPLEQPPAVCTSLRDIVRIAWFFSTRYPGIALLLIARDIESAYKKMLYGPAEGPSQCMQLPADGLRLILAAAVTIVSVTAGGMFGGQATAGLFSVLMWAALGGAMRLRPPDPRINGSGAAGGCHVDDALIIVPRLGDAADYAGAAFKQTATAVFGPSCLEEDKLRLHGAAVRSRRRTLRLPPKLPPRGSPAEVRVLVGHQGVSLGRLLRPLLGGETA